MANVGLISFYGAPRVARSRVLSPVAPKDTDIQVEPGLGWKTGDMIGLAPSTMNWWETDYGIITAYNNLTGKASLDRPMSWQHWGQATSTAADYSGVDMRGEVVLLSRNIQIVGNDTEDWGGQVVTSDFYEEDGTLRSGLTLMDNVEIFNCSQRDTTMAAVRFEGSFLSNSTISNSAIHHGLGMGVTFLDAANQTLVNNTIFMFVGVGIYAEKAASILIQNNWVISINSQLLAAMSQRSNEVGMLICGKRPGDWCPGVQILQNMVAGVNGSIVDTAGYVVKGHKCGREKNQTVFRDNIAHSI